MKKKYIYELYSHASLKTLKELLLYCAEKYGNKPAFLYPRGKDETVAVTYAEFRDHVEAFGSWLLSQGFENCHIAVYGENSYEWILTHFSVTCTGNVIVPIDKDLPIGEVTRLIEDSGSVALVYASAFSDEVASMNLSGVNEICMKDIKTHLSAGKKLLKNGFAPFADLMITDQTLATIVYTSGTTGASKGVMLTHGNLTNDAVATCRNVSGVHGTLLLLPLHHTFGLVASVLCALVYGHYVYINKSLKHVSRDLTIARPDYVSLVPMIIEGMHKRIWDTAEKEGKAKALKALVKVGNALSTVGIDCRRKLFKPVLASFGGRLETIISGGAPIDDKYIDSFKSFGITVVNGYGITECGPVVSVNRNLSVKKGSAGLVLTCNEVKIRDSDSKSIGEILVKGSNVMCGYYKNSEATEEAFDGDWFKTGDLGYIDEDGFLYVTGRIKNLIILSNGKNVSPEKIEAQLSGIVEIREVVVRGENDRIVAEVFPDCDVPDVQRIIKHKINEVNLGLPSYEQIQDIRFRDCEFPKTTTKKIKRQVQ